MTLYNDNYERVIPRLGFVDAVISDPPYAITKARCDSAFNMPLFWNLIETVKTSPHTPVVLFCGQPFTTDLINSNREQFKYCWYWVKNTMTSFANAWKMPMRRLEEIAVFYEKQPVYNQNLRYSQKLKDGAPEYHKKSEMYAGNKKIIVKKSLESVRIYSGYTGFNANVLFFDKPNSTANYHNHPFEKPVDLMEFLIDTYTDKGGVVLDPFMGTGSTGVACKHTGRDFIGIEVNRSFFDIAKNRVME
ncbi:MAG: site-specific DNA-methyltransferase [Treponema sp.]|jgi:site-specific DNA-methyltransferase (adenine-specific)|nr:site-specific DNA-methyltransferase [Treponema sp.]